MEMRTSPRRDVIDTVFLGLLSVALFTAFPPFSDIYRLWRREAGEAIVGGLVAGEFEYPPLAALYFEPLSWLPSSRWAVVVNGLLMVAAAVGVTLILHKARDAHFGDRIDMRLWVISPALLFFLPINWDVAACFLTVAALLMFYSKQTTGSGAFLGAGTSLKIFPGAPVLPLAALLSDWRERLRFLGAGAVVLGGSYLVYMAARPATWRIHLDFAQQREDYEATIWGLVDSVAHWFGGELGLSTVNVLSTVALIGGIALVTVWAWRSRPEPLRVVVLSIIVLLLANKVFKPQYVLWVLPFLAWYGSRRWQVRVLEVAAIVQISVTYFSLPRALVGLATGARILMLCLLGVAVFTEARAGQRVA